MNVAASVDNRPMFRHKYGCRPGRSSPAAVATVFGLPDSLDLRAGGRAYRAQVMRRRAGTLGVKFI